MEVFQEIAETIRNGDDERVAELTQQAIEMEYGGSVRVFNLPELLLEYGLDAVLEVCSLSGSKPSGPELILLMMFRVGKWTPLCLKRLVN